MYFSLAWGDDSARAFAQPIQPSHVLISNEKVNALLEPIRAKHGLPALAAAVVQNGQVIAIGAVGVRKAGDPTPVTIDDQWHIGSCTKAMTATVAAMLIERGKLRWDSTIKEVLGPQVKNIHADYERVTLEQLLQHRGGTPAHPPGPLWMQLWAHAGSPREQRQALLEGILTAPPASPPGSRFEYSNTGYAIAGAMIETIMDKPYEDVMREMLFAPLGMNHTGFGPPGSPEKVDQPRGHQAQSGQPLPIEPGKQADNPSCIAPAGKVHCTLQDWGKFLTLHAGIQSDGSPLLKPETLERLHSPPQNGEYSAGWTVVNRAWAQGHALTHAGSNTMWFAQCWVAPKRRLALVMTTNYGHPQTSPAALDEAAVALLSAIESLTAR